jgi:hypothetical protein
MSDLIPYGGQPMCVMGLEERNRRAHEIITEYARKHAMMDVGIGLTALVPLPGAPAVALIMAILAQAPLIYRPMTADLAAVYSANIDQETNRISNEAVLLGAAGDVAAQLGSEFLQEIASELITEAAAGLAASTIPIIGALFAAGLDAAIAATLTWRVGTMVSLYFQNGEAWIQSRKETYHVAKKLVGGYSPQTDDRVDLNDIGHQNPVIEQKHLDFVLNLIDMLKSLSANRGQIVDALRKKKVPDYLVQEALKISFAV